MVLLAILLLAGRAMLSASSYATLTGVVRDAAGKPLDHATVLVYHAGVKRGYSTFCPSCYIDCGKRALTDASGAFTITGLSPGLWFELLVVHEGFTPTFAKRTDPLQGPAPTAVLTGRTLVDDPARVVRGRVVDKYGEAIRDAVITPFAVLVGDKSEYGTVPGLDPIATTNDRGEFEIANHEATSKMALMVEARGMAPKFIILQTGLERRMVTVSNGAWVRGRLMRNGKPVAGVEIGLTPRESWQGGMDLTISGSVYDESRIGTRDDGSFAITNVPAPEKWIVYAKMESIASQGATDPVVIATSHDNQEVNVGDIEIKLGYRLRGRVVLSDGKQIADGMRVYIGSDVTRDTQSLLLPADGSFEFKGLAEGSYSLWAAVKGYARPTDGPDKAIVDRDIDHFDVSLQAVKAEMNQH
jgi:hypothetical protein